MTEERLADINIEWKDESAACVVIASGGYPESYKKGYPIELPEDRKGIYVAGAELRDGVLVTSGGRVLGVTETAPSLPEALEKAYRTAEKVHFTDMHMRRDIGKRALSALGIK